MQLKQTPEQWKAKNPRTKDAVSRILSEVFAEKGKPSQLDANLTYFVWHASACAATYDKNADPYFLKRLAQTREHTEGRATAQAAVAKLRASLRRIPDLAPGAILRTIHALPAQGVRLSTTSEDRFMPVDELFEILLDELHRNLDCEVLGMGSGSFLHRTRIGCLDYPESLEGISRPPEADMMLLFSAVLHFRRHSLGLEGLQEGEPMPEAGQPHYRLAAAIVQAVFPESRILDAGTAQNRLQRLLSAHRGLVWMSWPHDQP